MTGAKLLAGLATVAATLLLLHPQPAAAAHADATCVYLAIGCAPVVLPPEETPPVASEPEPPAQVVHYRRRHVRRHRLAPHNHVESLY